MKKVKSKYAIKPEFKGKEVWTVKPAYDRPGGSKFKLSDDLSEEDKAFLFEVVGHEGIVKC